MTIIEGNRLYIVCTVCGADTEHSQMLGQRLGSGYHRAPDRRLLDAWFETHAKCGDTLDHFRLVLAKPANWDVWPVISPDSHVGAHVKTALALVKS
jgi:hypothetical protein